MAVFLVTFLDGTKSDFAVEEVEADKYTEKDGTVDFFSDRVGQIATYKGVTKVERKTT